MCESALLLFAEQSPDGGFDAFLLRLLVEGVLAASYTTQGAGLSLQRGHDPVDKAYTKHMRLEHYSNTSAWRVMVGKAAKAVRMQLRKKGQEESK